MAKSPTVIVVETILSLDCLDDVTRPAHFGSSVQQGDFQKALDDLAGSFLGEEDKGEALLDKLANILNLSLRRRPAQVMTL